ncbi:MAG: scavenger receptor cysteine-rich domain-containing protein [Arenicellales bacterium]
MYPGKLLLIILALLNFTFISSASAHDKVVVIPLGGDDAPLPQFRIIGLGGSDGQVYNGRLEFTADTTPDQNSLWGTVCDDMFSNNNNAANAICQDLGFSSGGTVLQANNTPDGTGFVILDDVVCPNGADSFSDCTHNDYHVKDCGHSEDVGVVCTPNAPPAPLVEALEFRIIPEPGGAGAGDGRLEAKYIDSRYPTWGTVCDDRFDENNNAANAICQGMGYASGVLRASQDTIVGEGLIFLDDMLCSLGATSYQDCTFVVLGSNCAHDEDVGVTCSN